MNDTIICWNNHLRAEGWTALFMFAMLTFVAYMSIGLSVLISWPFMKVFYGTLFEIIF